MNKLKVNHSYLVKYTQWTGQSPAVEKITVLTVTQTCYEIQWENRKTWEEISAFDPRISVVEDLGEVQDSCKQTTKEVEDELEKLRKKLDPFEGDDLRPRRHPYWPRPWRIDDPVPYWPIHPRQDWWRITCVNPFGIIAKDPEHPAAAWSRGYAEQAKREGY